MSTERGNARKNKADEFYTQLIDIENELKHYKEDFKNKIVFCNCDDPYESNFFKYFAMNFNHLGLKKLIATSYDSSPIAYTQLSLFDMPEKLIHNKNRKAYKIEISEVSDFNNDGAVDLSDVEYLLKNKKNSLTLLNGDGDFRSDECIELLKQADIVVTNPPFSLFREYVSQLIEYNKKFLIIGNINALTYKEIFKLVQTQQIWAGYIFNKTIEFEVPHTYKGVVRNGKKYGKVPSITWFTNIDNKKRNEELIMYKTYSKDEYAQYYKYNAINVNKVADIPCDYDGVMGVPITFLDKYNPEQFEIIGFGAGELGREIGIGDDYTEEELAVFKLMNNKYKDMVLDPQKIEERVKELMMDDEITKRSGIYEYILSGNEKHLNLRQFTENEKRIMYETQKGICPHCRDEGRAKIHYEIEEMEADHITPWSEGGRTNLYNCQLLCKEHNRRKSNR
ncbi:MAG: modification methylase [Clostridiales bacterium]|nr:modification methylase [Clostridiales bacterium]